MTKFSSIAVLTAFFVCGIALGAHARNVEKIARQGPVSVEVSNGTEHWQGFGVPMVSAVPKYLAEEILPDECTVIAKKTCGDEDFWIAIFIEYKAETCEEAAKVVDEVMDKIDCVGFD